MCLYILQLGEVNGSMLISLLNLPTAGRLTIVILKCKDLRVDDDVDAGIASMLSLFFNWQLDRLLIH